MTTQATSNVTYELQAITHDDRLVTIASSKDLAHLTSVMNNQSAANVSNRNKYYRKLQISITLLYIEYPHRRTGGPAHE